MPRGQNLKGLSIDWGGRGVGMKVSISSPLPCPVIFLYSNFENIKDLTGFLFISFLSVSSKRCQTDALSSVYMNKSLPWFSLGQKYSPTLATCLSGTELQGHWSEGYRGQLQALQQMPDLCSLTRHCDHDCKVGSAVPTL